jgi:hypothetical protein
MKRVGRADSDSELLRPCDQRRALTPLTSTVPSSDKGNSVPPSLFSKLAIASTGHFARRDDFQSRNLPMVRPHTLCEPLRGIGHHDDPVPRSREVCVEGPTVCRARTRVLFKNDMGCVQALCTMSCHLSHFIALCDQRGVRRARGALLAAA